MIAPDEVQTIQPNQSINSSNRPEAEVLLLCAQPTCTDVDLKRIRSLLSGDFNWSFLHQLLKRHSLLPLVYQRLNPTCSGFIPDAKLQELRLGYQQNVARSLVFADELIQLSKALGDSSIESIAYKGPVLSQLAYGNPASRQYVDLDLMVRRQDVLGAAAVLIDRGYEAAGDFNTVQRDLLLRTQHNLQFARDEGKVVVELHWQVSSHLFASSVTAEELWENLETVKINGSELRTFSIDDLLFSLCVHGSRHLWERLLWIADIAQLVHIRRDIDWPALLKRADKAQATRMFLLGLHLAQVLLKAPLPDDVSLKISEDKRVALMATKIAATFFDGPEHHAATAGQIFRYNVYVRNSWQARFRYIRFTLVPTDSDLRLFQLPVGMRFVYYLLRPLRLFSKARSKSSVAGTSLPSNQE